MKFTRPMLAKNTTPETAVLPAYLSCKLEGIRFETLPKGFKMRSMKPCPNPLIESKFERLQWFAQRHNLVFEGELYIHGWEFHRISSAARKYGNPEGAKLELHLFDMYDPDAHGEPFSTRYENLKKIVLALNIPDVYYVHQELVETPQDIDVMYEEFLSGGFEGVCLKKPSGVYKQGRSTPKDGLFHRIKPQDTHDGHIIGFEERMENLCESERNELGYLKKAQDKDMKAGTGMVGVCLVKCPDFLTPVRVTMSRNLTDADRAYIWDWQKAYLGRHMQFVSLPLKGQVKPKAARFDKWREDLD